MLAAAAAMELIHTFSLVHDDLRLSAIGRLPGLKLGLRGDVAEARVRHRDVWFPANGFVATPVHWRPGLIEGACIPGPAIIEAVDSTAVVPPGWTARVDDMGFIRLNRS